MNPHGMHMPWGFFLCNWIELWYDIEKRRDQYAINQKRPY